VQQRQMKSGMVKSTNHATGLTEKKNAKEAREGRRTHIALVEAEGMLTKDEPSFGPDPGADAVLLDADPSTTDDGRRRGTPARGIGRQGKRRVERGGRGYARGVVQRCRRAVVGDLASRWRRRRRSRRKIGRHRVQPGDLGAQGRDQTEQRAGVKERGRQEGAKSWTAPSTAPRADNKGESDPGV
jgi:hypothetical protein